MDEIHDNFIDYARDESEAVRHINTNVVGARVDVSIMTDGVPDVPLERVKKGGRVSYFYNFTQAIVDYAMTIYHRWADDLPLATPDSPKYSKSIVVMTDRNLGDKTVSVVVPWPGIIKGVFVEIVDLQPYAGSLEPHTRARRGPRTSRMAPNGLAELVTANLRARWGSVAKINMVSKQWPTLIIGKNPYYHLPTITISPNYKGVLKFIGS